ncbi:MAG TPA: hypothetical protein PLP42_03030 [Acidobacteriota bacterium]|nr:hypothetical protein [Acidobacteriota bacterium]
MKKSLLLVVCVLLLSPAFGQSDPTSSPAKPKTEELAAAVRLPLTKESQALVRFVTAGTESGRFLMDKARLVITDTVRRWSGVELAASTETGTNPAIVLATSDELDRLFPAVARTPAFLALQALDDHGFICHLVGQRYFIVGRTPRGIFNGAQYVADFLIDGPRSGLYLEARTIIRSPQMLGRPVYLLTIWGNEDEYTASDFARIFDSFARDGMDRIYFWASGHFPSKKFPQTYKVADSVEGKVYDATTESGFGSVDALRQITRQAHERGLKLYLGGALGGWTGTRFLTNLDRRTFKKGSVGDSGHDDSDWSLCPSLPQVRNALVAYWAEMFDAIPEADGLFIESADEMGGCNCSECSKPVDTLGSRQFGQAQLTLVLEIMNEIWRRHPRARLAYTVGYKPHSKDPAYYELIRKLNDPRLEWMEARGSWEMPGPEGQPWPAPYFSPRIMGWKYHDNRPLEQLVSDIQRMGKEGWYGAISTFSPGFSSGSFYREIPFPTHLLPYVLTHFLHREMTWEPAVTVDEALRRTQARFFGSEAPEFLGRDLWTLREMIRNSSRGVWTLAENGEWGFVGKCAAKPGDLDSLDPITRRIEKARQGAGPKTTEGLELMAGAVADLRSFCAQQISQR